MKHVSTKQASGKTADPTPTIEDVQRAYADACAALQVMFEAAGHVILRTDLGDVIERTAEAERAVKAMAHALGIDTDMPPWDSPVTWNLPGRDPRKVMAEVLAMQHAPESPAQ